MINTKKLIFENVSTLLLKTMQLNKNYLYLVVIFGWFVHKKCLLMTLKTSFTVILDSIVICFVMSI